MFCPFCGSPIENSWKYCRACGRQANTAIAADNRTGVAEQTSKAAASGQDLRAVLGELSSGERAEQTRRLLNEEQSRYDAAHGRRVRVPKESGGRTDHRSLGGQVPALLLLLGAFVGYLLRPSLPIVGQLPFGAVITRGAYLGSSVSQATGSALAGAAASALAPLAQASFNYMAIGASVGLLIGVFVEVFRRD